MSLLEQLENSFNLLSLRVKIELFLFPLILLLLIWYLFFENIENKKEISFNTNLVKNIDMKDSYISIIKDIEEYCEKSKIILKTIENQEQIIRLQIETDLKKQIRFIKFIEDYNSFSKISNLKIDKNSLYTEVDFKKLYVKNRFSLDKKIDKLFKEVRNYKLNAIIDNKAFINQKWVSLNGKIDSYRLIDINMNSILLEDLKKKRKIRLYINEDI